MPENLGRVKGQPENTNYLRTPKFSLQFSRIPNIQYFCQAVALPGMDMGSWEQPVIGGVGIERSGDMNFSDVVVRFIVDEKLANWKEISDWMRSCTNTEGMDEYIPAADHFSDATLIVQNSNYGLKYRFVLNNLWPKALDGFTFDAGVSEDSPFILNATFAMTSYQLEDVSPA